jgi:hypothetical protein
MNSKNDESIRRQGKKLEVIYFSYIHLNIQNTDTSGSTNGTSGCDNLPPSNPNVKCNYQNR